jgi:hypothetical protein
MNSTSGRSIHMVCMADVRSVSITPVAKALHRELVCVGKIPPAYRPRVAVLQDIANDADANADEPSKRQVLKVLTGTVQEMKVSIAGYRAALGLYQTLRSLGAEDLPTRQQLIAEMTAREARDLAWDLEPA